MKILTKLFLANFAVLFGLCALLFVIGLDFVHLANVPAQRAEVGRRAVANLRKLSTGGELALATANKTTLRELASSLKDDPDLTFVSIWNQKKQLLAGWGEGAPTYGKISSLPQNKLKPLGGQHVVWQEVKIEGVSVGSVALGYSFQRVNQLRQRTTLFFVVLLVGVLISGAVSYLLSSRITRPMQGAIVAFRRMAAGDLKQPPMKVKSADEAGELAEAFNELLDAQRSLGRVAQQMASGDLSVTFAEKGDLADSFRLVLSNQRHMVQQITEAAVQLTSAMAEFQSGASQQERGAVEQSSAIEENQRTMSGLLDSARQVAETAQGVFQNAERTHANNRLVAERIATLSTHTQRIGEILQVIKEIANKSDLLALNAALEGTKAGEAGRGFSLVAGQMQRLAENVVASVQDIKELTNTVAEATRATVLATEESTKLAGDTTRSARQIVMIVQQQQSGTEQMTKALEDVANIAREAASGAKQFVASATDLVDLSSRLSSLVQQFKLDAGPTGAKQDSASS